MTRARVQCMCVALVAWSCATGRKTAPATSAAPPPPPAFPGGQVPPPGDVLALARARVAPLQALGAVLKVKGFTQLPGATLLADAWVGRPAWAYVGVRGPLGPPMDEIATDGDAWRWSSVRPGAGGQGGRASDGRVPLPVPAELFVGTLWGLPIPDTEPLEVSACAAADVPADFMQLPFCIGAAWADVPRAWLAGDAGGAVHRVLILQRGESVDLHYADFQPAGGVLLPRSVRIRRGAADVVTVDVKLLEVFPNAPRPRELFRSLLGTREP